MFEELKTFIAVVHYQNFTKAAEALHLSQPSVSAHIKHLEQRFNTLLIQRSIKQKNIVITQSGYKLFQFAKEILHLVEYAYEAVPALDDDVYGTLKIGASLTIGEYLLPNFLATFVKKYPKLNIELYINNSANICSKVSELSLDIGFIEGMITTSQFFQNYFFKDYLVLAVPYHPDLNAQTLTLSYLQHRKWVVRENGSGTRSYLDRFFNQYALIPESIMVVGSNYAIKEAVKNNLGITLISHLVTQPAISHKELSILYLDENFSRNFSYIMPSYMPSTKLIDLLVKELTSYCQNLNFVPDKSTIFRP